MATLRLRDAAHAAAVVLAVLCVVALLLGLRGMVQRTAVQQVRQVTDAVAAAVAAVQPEAVGPDRTAAQVLAGTSWGSSATVRTVVGPQAAASGTRPRAAVADLEGTGVRRRDGRAVITASAAVPTGVIVVEVPYAAVSSPLSREALLVVALTTAGMTATVVLFGRAHSPRAATPHDDGAQAGAPPAAGGPALPDRAALADHVDRLIDAGHPEQCLLLLGLAGLQDLGGSLTSHAADALAAAIADRILAHPAVPCTVARTSEDQFGVLLGASERTARRHDRGGAPGVPGRTFHRGRPDGDGRGQCRRRLLTRPRTRRRRAVP